MVQGRDLLLEAGSALGPDQVALSSQVSKISTFSLQIPRNYWFCTLYLFLQALSSVKPYRPLNAPVKWPILIGTLEEFSVRDVIHFPFEEFPCCWLFLTIHLRVLSSITKQTEINRKPFGGVTIMHDASFFPEGEILQHVVYGHLMLDSNLI